MVKNPEKEERIRISRQVAVVAAVFTALVSLLMILNYMQIRGSQPLESKSMTMLIERLSADPGNELLIEEIRQLDLLARRAYFNSIWQIRTGAWLMIIGTVVLVIALRIYLGLQFRIEKPGPVEVGSRQARFITQRWVLVSGLAILVLAGLSAFLTIDHLAQYDTIRLAATPSQPADGIERVEITPGSTRAGTADTLTGEQAAGSGIEASAIDADTLDTAAETAAADTEEPVSAVPLTAESVASNHNAFRGAWGNGVSSKRNIPASWDGPTSANILWKTPLPLHGYNSPIRWGDKLFMSGASPQRRIVFCIDRHSGNIVWEREVNNIPGSPATPPRTTEDTGLAAPTMTTDGQRVFAIFGTGDIIAFDLEGNRLWARNLGVPQNHYGHSSSLLTWDGKVFVQYDTQDGSRVMALDNKTGETVWQTNRSDGISWASPILARVGNAFQLILAANPTVSAYDISTGRELWKVACMSGEVGPSPAYGGGLVYAANEYARMVAINPETGTQVWEDNYYLPEVSSPLYHDGLLYIATSYAVFACFDASNGEFLWEFDAENGFYSSPMLADGKIFVFDLEGQAYIFMPGREVRLIASPKLGEKVFATPVFADGRIYIRGNRHLYCIGE